LDRVKAALIHLLISVFVFSIFLSLVFFIWYAYPFNITQGVAEIVYMMAGIDIVLGPLLTLIVFNTAKKSLKFDLSVIGFVQIAALIFGGYIIYSERPAWVAFAVDRFEVVGLFEIDSSEIPDKSLKVGIFDRPKMVYIEPPTGELANKILFDSLSGGNDVDRTPSLYRAIEPNEHIVYAAAKDFQSHPELHNDSQADNLKWLPVKGKLKSVLAIFDVKTQEIIEYRMINPWIDSVKNEPK